MVSLVGYSVESANNYFGDLEGKKNDSFKTEVTEVKIMELISTNNVIKNGFNLIKSTYN